MSPDSLGAAVGATLGFVTLMWFVINGLVFGLPAGWLADQKGRGALTWGLLGMVVGPVALATVGFAPRAPAGRFGACPTCAEAIPVSAAR